MAYTTFRISTKELTDVYLPVKDGFDKMKDSIISNGFGQIISNYNGPRNFTVNSYHVWDESYNSMVVKTADYSMTYTESQVGPSLWGVTSEVGVSFLYGNTKITGLSIIKYCDGCEDSNGLPLQIIDSYSKRFQYVKELNDNYSVETSYIFYDFTLPSNQRWFPAVYDTDNGDFIFKDYLGNIKDKTQLSTITSISVNNIDMSLDESKPPIPSKCTDINLSYSISRGGVCYGVQSLYSYDETNSLLYNSDSCDEMFAPKGYYSDGKFIYLWDGRRYREFGRCSSCKTKELTYSTDLLAICNGRLTPTSYEIDGDTGVIYNFEECGGKTANIGYYGDGDVIYYWDGEKSNETVCPDNSFGGPWVSNIIIPQYTDTFAIPTTTYIGFTGVQDGSPTNAIYAQLQITIDPQISDGTRNIQRDIYKYNVLELVNGQWVQAMDKDNRPIGYGDYSLDKNGNRNKLNYRQVYNSSTSQWTMYEGEYLLLYGSTFAYNGDYYNTRTPFTNQFNQRIFKILIYPIWQDDTSYYEIVVNAGDTSNTPNIVSSTSYNQGVQL